MIITIAFCLSHVKNMNIMIVLFLEMKAWELWDKGRATDLLDSSISKSSLQEQVLRCIHVGMLCVQDVANHRPNMPAVLLMLESENVALPKPRQPTFTSMRHNLEEDMWNSNQEGVSSNNVTMSVILGR